MSDRHPQVRWGMVVRTQLIYPPAMQTTKTTLPVGTRLSDKSIWSVETHNLITSGSDKTKCRLLLLSVINHTHEYKAQV